MFVGDCIDMLSVANIKNSCIFFFLINIDKSQK